MRIPELSSSGKVSAAQKEALMMETFLEENYRFRRNALNGKPEFVDLSKNKEDDAEMSKDSIYRTLDNVAMNTIVRRCRLEGIAKKPKTLLEEYVFSDAVKSYNPIQEYLHGLPAWNGNDEVGKMLNRLPGLTGEQNYFMRIWFRSTVAHWLQLDTLHGNECVPTLIGAQGCGKSTFVQRILPKELRCYYLDHFNLSNKFDKEMALANNLLVNLDELEAIRPSQQASLKQALSKTKVNGRIIHTNVQQDRPRFASFVATTNNPHPLSDVTGSRRYLCLVIPEGSFINNEDTIDYEQLFAQIVNEVSEQKMRYWFSNEEVKRVQEMNLQFMSMTDIPDMVKCCFRKPLDKESVMPLSSDKIIAVIAKEFPHMKVNHGTKVLVGRALKELGFERKEMHNGMLYYAVPNSAA